ncbi:MAG TPA: hypothetical protein VIH28_07660 [Ignavibacteriaceae bacterium]
MVLENPMFKLSIFVAIIFSLFFLGFSYLFFEKSLTEKEISITVINKEKFGNEEGRYLIFTPEEVFENSDNFYHRKTNADMVYKKLERGVRYRVKVVGVYLPGIRRLRNITEVLGTEVKKEGKF